MIRALITGLIIQCVGCAPMSAAENGSQSRAGDEQAWQLIDKVWEASGGMAVLKKHDAMVFSSTGFQKSMYCQDEPIKVEQVRFPDGSQIRKMFAPSHLLISATTADNGWFADGGIAYKSSPSEIAEAAYNKKHTLRRGVEFATTASLLKPEVIDQEPCNVIQLSFKNMPPLKVWVSKKTNLIVQSTFEDFDSPNKRKPHSTIFNYSQYKMVDGEMIPMVVEEKARDYRLKYASVSFTKPSAKLQAEALRFPGQSESFQMPLRPGEKDKLLMSGWINDHVAMFILDTGSSLTNMDSGFAKKTGVLTHGNPDDATAMFSTSGVVPGVMQSMQLGDMKFSQVPVYVQDDPMSSPVCLLGMDFIRQYAITIDYDARLLTFTRGAPVAVPTSAVVIPFVLHQSIYIKGAIGNEPEGWFLFDTGTGKFAYVSEIPKDFTELSPDRTFDANGAERPVRSGTVPAVKVGGKETFVQAQVHVLEGKSLGNEHVFGIKLLDRYRAVTIDFENQRLICIPRSDK